jgi:hypothetical protein
VHDFPCGHDGTILSRASKRERVSAQRLKSKYPFVARERRLSARAVKRARVWRSLERTGNPCTEGADGSGADSHEKGQRNGGTK